MTADLGPGSAFGPYRIESLLGRGGMSVVYLAEDTRLGRRVAIKVLAPELAADEAFRSRFVRESQLAAGLEHPNIVPVYEAGENEGHLFIAMRYVRGTDLRARIVHDGPLEPDRAILLLRPVAAALDAAHRRGLVHRDVKPGNILIASDEDGEHVYLSDFGLTKHTSSRSGLTRTGQFMGTVDYVAPEQIQGLDVDGRADEYSLACVLYECLTSRVPFQKDSDVATLFGHIQDPPPRVTEPMPALPGEIDEVIARGMAKDRDARPRTCAALIEEAARALGAPSGPREAPRVPPAPTAIASAASGPGAAVVSGPPASMPPPGPSPSPSAPPASSPASSPPAPPPSPDRRPGEAPPSRSRARSIGLLVAAGLAVAAAIVVIVVLSGGEEPGPGPVPSASGASPSASASPTPAIPSGPRTFSSPEAISIPDVGGAQPYPAAIAVSGIGDSVQDVTVTVSGLTHPFPEDVDILLVGPSGASVVLMSDVGGSHPVSALTLTFDDSAAGVLGDRAQIRSRTVRPTVGTALGGGSCCGFEGGPPAPETPTATTLAVFDGSDPNGTWNLFVFDDSGGDAGEISGGWSLVITAGAGSTGTPQPSGSAGASPATFSNAAAIVTPDTGPAGTYPSTIEVSGVFGTIADVDVTLVGLTHPFPDDLDVLLVAPSGDAVVLMADVGGAHAVEGATITLDDAAPAALRGEGRLGSGSFRPTSADLGFEGPSPAPAPPYETLLGALNGIDPNGTWELFVFDDAPGDAGQIAGGWSLDLELTG